MDTLVSRISWSKKEYAMRDLVSRYHDSLPILCKTTSGFNGGDSPINVIGSDEIYWIYGIEKQTRLVCKTHRGQNLLYVSIPTDYYLKLETNNKKDRPALLAVDEAVQKLQDTGPKFHVRFEGNPRVAFNQNCEGGNSAIFGDMEVIDTYQQKYLATNTVIGQNINRESVSLPVYMEVSFAVGEGLVNCPDDTAFTTWFNDVRKLQESFKRTTVETFKGLIVFSECPQSNDEYEYIRPGGTNYYNTVGPQQQQQLLSAQSQNVYDEIPRTMPSVRCGRNEVVKSVRLPSPPQPPPPPSTTGICQSVIRQAIASIGIGSVGKKRPPPMTKPKSNGKQTVSVDPGSSPTTGNLSPTISPPKPPPTRQTVTTPVADERDNGLAPGLSLIAATLSQSPPPHPHPPQPPPSTSSATGRRGCRWKTAADVPRDVNIAGWSTHDVADCLRLLRIDESKIAEFEAQDVDGRLLLGLDEPMLLEQFALNAFHARKVISFVRDNWRPAY